MPELAHESVGASDFVPVVGVGSLFHFGLSAAGADCEVAVDGGHDLVQVESHAAAEADARDEFRAGELVDESRGNAEDGGEFLALEEPQHGGACGLGRWGELVAHGLGQRVRLRR